MHAHIFPRYLWEGAERGGPVWLYPRDRWTDSRYRYSDEAHGALQARIGDELKKALQQSVDAEFG